MRIVIFTLFPEMFGGPLGTSIVGRAVTRGLATIELRNFRDHATDRHRSVDDYPYGGGAGMVLRPEPLFAAVEAAALAVDTPIALLTPQGRLFDQRLAGEFARQPEIALICGHYEGVDERVRAHLATDEISIGDFVLSGGELAAMVMVDAMIRLLPGAIDSASLDEESHQSGVLEYPHYTRPAEYRDWPVPAILLSGNHAAIAKWRREQALRRTWERRPGMLAAAVLSPAEQRLVRNWETEQHQVAIDPGEVIP